VGYSSPYPTPIGASVTTILRPSAPRFGGGIAFPNIFCLQTSTKYPSSVNCQFLTVNIHPLMQNLMLRRYHFVLMYILMVLCANIYYYANIVSCLTSVISLIKFTHYIKVEIVFINCPAIIGIYYFDIMELETDELSFFNTYFYCYLK